MPVYAVISAGSFIVYTGSTTARVTGWRVKVLIPVSSFRHMMPQQLSLPVPAVVGMAIIGSKTLLPTFSAV